MWVYPGVKEQAGIHAGDGGFDVSVKGNTALTGAVISSTAEASKNSLSTGTLTFSDVENRSHYSANSIGGSMGLAANGTQEKAVGPASVPGSGGLVPMIGQSASGDQSSTTRSAIGAGAITVTNPAAQTQDVAALSRDSTDTNGTVARTPDVSHLLDKQADTMQAAQAAGQVVAQGIGAYADMKRDAALAAGDKATADAWDEGGTNRTIAHVVGGGLIGGLGGGAFGAVGGAAGAGVASALAGKLNGLADDIGGATGSMLAGNIAANVLAGMGGALVGGGAGAAMASNADLYNRSTGNGNGTGGTDSELVDRIWSAAKDTAKDPLGALNHALNSLIPKSGPQPQADANPLIDVTGNNRNPPAAGGSAVPVAVCVPPVCTVVPVATPGTPGYGPGNAIFNDSGDAAKSPSTPTGMSGSPMDVPRGTNAPATINGVEYSAHAIDQMQGRGVPPSAVKNTIENGVIYPTREGTTGYYDPLNNMRVITNSKTGSVVTVIPGAPGK